MVTGLLYGIFASEVNNILAGGNTSFQDSTHILEPLLESKPRARPLPNVLRNTDLP